MISAQQAKANTDKFIDEEKQKIYIQVDKLLDTISASIEYHSKNGFFSLDFMPYDKSLFPTEISRAIAQKTFNDRLRLAGYQIVINNPDSNVLRIQW